MNIWPVFLVLIIHGAACMAVIFLSGLRLLRVRLAAFPLMMLVPVFGPVSVLALELNKRLDRNGTADIEVDHFRLESEIYSSMGFRFEDDKNEEVIPLEEAMILNKSDTRRDLMLDLLRENVVPLEEALTISTADVRRRLMMDVLTSDTAAFYSLLEQARLNDDVEVVHYATTAMSELNKQYDLMLQKCIDNYQSDPDNPDYLRRYCDCLKQYLNLGLVRGQMEQLRRREYISLLQKQAALMPSPVNYSDLVGQQLLVSDLSAADASLQEMEQRWPDNENTWLLRLQYYARSGDGNAIAQLVQDAVNSEIYFSPKAREQLQFWSGKEANV